MRKMLIVDDEETIRWALAELFMQEGWEVHGAADGAEAANMVAGNVYDYMITDLRMPGRQGTDVIREARRHNGHMGITVLTGYATVETAVEAVRMGAWDYITKPCSIEELKGRIDEFVQQADHAGRRHPPAGPPEQEDLVAFLMGRGTSVLQFESLATTGGPAPMLDALRRMLRDLGFGAVRSRELTQSCVEAIAALSGGPGVDTACAGLLGGRVLVGIGHRADPPDDLPATLDRLRNKFRVDAGLLQHDDGCTVVLSEAI